MLLRRRRETPRPIYLVSVAGLPNFGDEFITRAWLDWLAENHPDVPVWLDCPEPGRANHLFADAHPNLTTTNTLWHLAFGSQGMSLEQGTEHAQRVVVDLGSPRFDLGLLQLREMASVHLLGGGYLNSIWQNHLFILPALTALRSAFDIPLYATGQGILPLDDDARRAVVEWVPQFDLFETRDATSAQVSGGTAGIDDAFLAFANKRSIYAEGDLPDTMLVIQGDFLDAEAAATVADAVADFVRSREPGTRIGLVESIPPDDSWVRPQLKDRGIDVEFIPFMDVWRSGFPARAGQEWLSTRFHFHLLAAAAGARGATIELRPDYYGIKHGSLRELGTGWAHTGVPATEPVVPTVNPQFSETRDQLARRKAQVARSIYG